MIFVPRRTPPIMTLPFDSLYWADQVPGDHGDPISVWQDIKGGYDVPAVTATYPTLSLGALNGHAAVHFDGTQGFRNTLFTMGQPRTMMVVVSMENSSHYQYIIDSATASPYRNLLAWQPSTPPAGIIVARSDDATPLVYSKSFSSDWIILTVVFNGATSKIYENGALKRTGATGTDEARGVTLGISQPLYPTYSLIGDMSMAGFFGFELAGAELTNMHQIVSDYSGIPLAA